MSEHYPMKRLDSLRRDYYGAMSTSTTDIFTKTDGTNYIQNPARMGACRILYFEALAVSYSKVTLPLLQMHISDIGTHAKQGNPVAARLIGTWDEVQELETTPYLIKGNIVEGIDANALTDQQAELLHYFQRLVLEWAYDQRNRQRFFPNIVDPLPLRARKRILRSKQAAKARVR